MMGKGKLEENQIGVYIITIIASIFIGLNWNSSNVLENIIEPIIGILLYSMFCQIPFLELKNAFRNCSFFKALLFGNFVLIPLLVWGLLTVFPATPIMALGILLVLLTPCIDYVIVFAHLGKGNSNAILAATPLLFVLQMLLLPLYLWGFLGERTIGIIETTPFVEAFLYLIVIPFLLSIATQMLSKSTDCVGRIILNFTGWLPVPFMALTLFVVITSQIGMLVDNPGPVFKIVPIYVAFAMIAPFIGKLSAKLFNLNAYDSRAVSFSTGTRNSLVVLPLAFALPSPENQLIAVIIVTQTIVELVFELIYIKAIPKVTPD